MVLKENQRIIGATGFDALDVGHCRGEFGYSLSRHYWGRGLATEAAKAVVQFGFEAMGLYRIEAKCMVENVASERVMQKVGLSFEGILRGYWLKHGAYQDVKLYSILRGNPVAVSR
jgi:ribosomal-protein-alanine N-acetyltransferase